MMLRGNTGLVLVIISRAERATDAPLGERNATQIGSRTVHFRPPRRNAGFLFSKFLARS